jgi:hypothetical protein
VSPQAPFQLSLFELEPLRQKSGRKLPSRDEAISKAETLARRLSRDLRVAVRLSVTDNRSTMVSFRRLQSGLRLRVHHMFLDAPEQVVRAIADYAGRGEYQAGPILDDYIHGRQPLIRQERDGKTRLDARGQYFDLQTIFDQLNQDYFQGGIRAKIGWGKMPLRRRRRSIRLGVYDHQTREIRIHPALDRSQVPAFFVQFIVFHEMLHQLFPSLHRQGRRVHHAQAFRDREKAFPWYAHALSWEKRNLRVLLRR